MKRVAFTLIEILTVLVIVAVLATVSLPLYQGFMEEQQATACETNLKALQTALDLYAMQEDSLPVTISAIPDEMLEKALAQVLNGPGGWKRKLAYFVVEQQERGLAYAQYEFIKNDLLKGSKALLKCPKDRRTDKLLVSSYGFNENIQNLSSRDYRRLSSTGTVLIMDCDQEVFGNGNQAPATRHRIHGTSYPIGSFRGGETKRFVVGSLGALPGNPSQPNYPWTDGFHSYVALQYEK